MGFARRIATSSTHFAVTLVIILCAFPRGIANSQVKVNRPILSMNLVRPHLNDNNIFRMNFTNQLAAARYMMKLYKNLNEDATDDNSPGFNVSNITTANGRVEKVDTIMGILNDGKLCLHANVFIFIASRQINKNFRIGNRMFNS